MKKEPIKLQDFPLKPCPFCGGKAVKAETENMVNIYCVVCGAQTRVFESVDKAVSAWEIREAFNTYISVKPNEQSR